MIIVEEFHQSLVGNQTRVISLNNALLSVNIEALIVCMNVHEKMPLHVITYPRAKENITGCEFTKKGFLCMNVMKISPPFLCSLYFTMSTTLMLNGSTPSKSFKYASFTTKLALISITD